MPSKRSGRLKNRITLDNKARTRDSFDNIILIKLSLHSLQCFWAKLPGAGLVLQEHAQRLHGKLRLPGKTIPMSFILVVEQFKEAFFLFWRLGHNLTPFPPRPAKENYATWQVQWTAEKRRAECTRIAKLHLAGSLRSALGSLD